LIVIAIVAAIVFAVGSPKGIRVLGRIWLVLSAAWIGLWYLSVAGHMGEPGYLDFRAATEML
jgi:hypothetical protein